MESKIYPVRKKNRLSDYDYSENGAYFITICTKDRKPILSRISVGTDIADVPSVVLSKAGIVVDQAIQSIPSHYENVSVDRYVIMPNHIHILLRLTKGPGRMVSAPTVVGSLKRFVSTQLGYSLWQKGFYDHVIRDTEDFEIKYRYIEGNPYRWAEDELFTAEL